MHQTFPKPVSRATLRKRAKAAKLHHYLQTCKAVDKRDRCCCRVCGRYLSGQGFLGNVHHHHVQYRSRGGTDDSRNICCLCSICHNQVHNGLLTIKGNADLKLTFNKDGHEWEG